MTTYTFSLLSWVYTTGGWRAGGIRDRVFTVQDGRADFTYTYDPAHAPHGLKTSFLYSGTGTEFVLVQRLSWGAGKVTDVIAVANGGWWSYLTLAGDPLPLFATHEQVRIFQQSITSAQRIPAGPFGPNAPIDFALVSGGTAVENDFLNLSNETSGVNFDAGIGDDTVYGSRHADRLLGGDHTDLLDGNAGSDTVFGGNGDDTVRGGSGDDLLYGSYGDDDLDGGDGNDTLYGGAGNDLLSGQYGNDTLYGGAGDDRFNVTAGSGLIYGGAGQDRVDITGPIARLVFDKAASVEILNGHLVGTTAANLFDVTGVLQIDWAYFSLNSGNDTFRGSIVGETVLGEVGNDLLYGNGGADSLDGGEGNDTINGGAGVDTLRGGAGDDTYIVGAGDKVIEDAGGGLDVVQSSVTFSLGGNLETLALTGTGRINGTGNGIANTIIGNGNNNVLNGGSGMDTLTGGLGNDTFVFKNGLGSTNVDTITDFNVADDLIHIDNAVFKNLVAGGLAASDFVALTAGMANTAGSEIIYETNTGRLLFDSDGNGRLAPVHFASVATGLALTYQDFFVI